MTLLLLEPSSWIYLAVVAIVSSAIALAWYFEYQHELARLATTTAIAPDDDEPVRVHSSKLIALQPVEFEHLNRIDTAAREYVAARRKQQVAIGSEYYKFANAAEERYAMLERAVGAAEREEALSNENHT